jgi:hypothetical protein
MGRQALTWTQRPADCRTIRPRASMCEFSMAHDRFPFLETVARRAPLKGARMRAACFEVTCRENADGGLPICPTRSAASRRWHCALGVPLGGVVSTPMAARPCRGVCSAYRMRNRSAEAIRKHRVQRVLPLQWWVTVLRPDVALGVRIAAAGCGARVACSASTVHPLRSE